MKVIRDHCITDDIKATFQTSTSEFDFQKHNSGFHFPTVKCSTDKSSNIIGKYFNINHYVAGLNTEFKRTVAEYFVPKVYKTQIKQRKVLLNYSPFKTFEMQAKQFPKRKHLCAIILSKHLAATIATRRSEWINIFFFKFHQIGDLAKSLIAKEKLADANDKKAALLGMSCHQRGVEPYFPSTAFISGKGYNYSVTEDTTMKCTDNEKRNVHRANENITSNTKDPDITEKTKHVQDTTNVKNDDILKQKLYQCTDDCIGASDEDYTLFNELLHTFSNATQKDIRNILDKYEYCTNIQLENMYRLPCEKRNHPQVCYEQGCEGSSVLIRKLAIHYKNGRRCMNILIDLIIAHSFIHDIDMATVLGDIDYLIKLVALPPNKQPSVFSSRDSPSKHINQMDELKHHIAEYEISCQDLPDTVCESCYMLEHKNNTKEPKFNWKHINNTEWSQLKELLNIKTFKNENISICSYCVQNYNSAKIPPRSRLNNMDLGICPKEIAILTPLELIFISKAKVFQTVIKLGAVGRNVPPNSRLSALKGNCIHMPLPLEHTIKQLDEDIGFSKLPSNYIMTHQIKGDELLLRNLVNLDNVYEALLWLKNNHSFYKDIDLPSRSELLFTSLPNEQNPDPTLSSHLPSSHGTCTDFEQADNNLGNSNVCSIHTELTSSNEENTVKTVNDHSNYRVQNKKNKKIHTDYDECSVIIDLENPPDVLEELEVDKGDNPSEMIQRLSSLRMQGQLEQYSVVDNEIKGESIMDVDNFYELIKIDSEPLSYKEKNIDVQAFLDVFPYGTGGQNSERKVYLQPNMYEKTRLLSGHFAVRRNMQYLFYLLQISEKRLINQGVYNTMKNVKFLGKKNVGQLLQMMKEGDNNIERNLNRVVSKIPNSPSYWNAPRSQLKCLSEAHGPATFFITFSPVEYDWPDMHTYLSNHIADLINEGISMNSLSTMDPVLTSVFIHQKFKSMHRFILESSCLGIVEHWFYRIEYQSRGTPHFHCMYWIKDAPIVGQSSDEDVMKFISEHITCEFPSKSENEQLHKLVDSCQNHKDGKYCLRKKKSKKGKFSQKCRFGFPRRITSKLILYNVVESILGRKSSDFKKRLYDLVRYKKEEWINDYNKILLSLWQGNMDIQFISENSYSLVGYITKYVTKADKSHLSNDDFGIDAPIRSRIWRFAYRCLKGREIGAYEAVDRWLLNSLYQCSDVFQFVPTVYPQNRTLIMKNFKDLEKTDQNSTDIFNKDLLSTYYPERPQQLENMSLKDYSATYERAYRNPQKNPRIYKSDPFIELNGKNNGIMKKKLKTALVHHHEFDPYVDPEKYYFSLLLLFKPWRNEAELKEKNSTYKEAFKKNVINFPQLQEYDKIKKKIMNSKKKVEDEVSKICEKIDEEGVDSEPEDVDIDDGNALDQALCDFEAINNVDNISTEAELNARVETLNPEQRKIYDKIISAISHSVAHAIKHCTCDSLQPLLLYVSGFGGTGKSYLIKTIMSWAYVKTNVLKTKCKIVLAAPTGISAAGISGMTLHSALSLPIEHNGKMTYKPLTGANLQQIQACMRHVNCVMIDEISMVSNLTLLHIHLRLTEIFGCKKRNNNWFGSQNVIVFGDLLQLPPVKGEEVFISLSEDKVKAAIGMMSTNLSLWSLFLYDELTFNQRQKNDPSAKFKECLARIRIGTVLPCDISLLSSCCIDVSKDKPMESLVNYYNKLAKTESPVCLLPTRSMVREFNDAVLASRSFTIIEILAIDEIDVKGNKTMKRNAIDKLAKMDLDDRNTAGLERCLRLSVGSRVMLRRNIDTGKKLVNGSTGTITKITKIQSDQVQQIVIQFDGLTDPVELKRDKRKIRIFENAYVYREQFPLTCAYSITVHKSQGLSLKCVMADLGDSIFSEGQIYVALSRVQTLSGLHLININFNKIKASSKALQFYASQSPKKGYNIEQPSKRKTNSEISENIWYTVSKRKKQTEMIKNVIAEEIRNVPSKEYKNVCKNNKDNKISVSQKKKRKNPDLTNKQTLPMKKLKVATRGHDSSHLAPSPQSTWFYNPVDVEWQQDRADSLGLPIYNNEYVTFKEPREVLRNAPPNHTYGTDADGNCFFKAISMYLTGKDDKHTHRLLRTMVTDHMLRNIDQFLVLKQMVDRPEEFRKYIDLKKSSIARNTTSNWADEYIIIATSSLLKTPIATYSPQFEDGVRVNLWCKIEAVTIIGEAVYDNSFRHFNHTEKQIVLNNMKDHFEPAEF